MAKRHVRRHEVTQPLDQSIKLIPLTKGHNAIVDASDYDFLNQWNWQVNIHSTDGPYARRYDRTYMHQLLVEFKADHVDGNGLNNRRSNLRPCTASQNSANRRWTRHPWTKGFRGTYQHGERWQAQIRVNHQLKYLGTFDTRDEAAHAYNEAAEQYFGAFAVLN